MGTMILVIRILRVFTGLDSAGKIDLGIDILSLMWYILNVKEIYLWKIRELNRFQS